MCIIKAHLYSQDTVSGIVLKSDNGVSRYVLTYAPFAVLSFQAMNVYRFSIVYYGGNLCSLYRCLCLQTRYYVILSSLWNVHS